MPSLRLVCPFELRAEPFTWHREYGTRQGGLRNLHLEEKNRKDQDFKSHVVMRIAGGFGSKNESRSFDVSLFLKSISFVSI